MIRQDHLAAHTLSYPGERDSAYGYEDVKDYAVVYYEQHSKYNRWTGYSRLACHNRYSSKNIVGIGNWFNVE